jgi:peptidyl-prolyl cis-trans isomerase SurA
MLKKIIKLMYVIIFVSLSSANVSFAVEVDKVVAVVDSEIITNLEVEKMKSFMIAVGAIDIESSKMQDANKHILNFQIERMLQLQLAEKFNIEVTTSAEKLKQDFLQNRQYSPQDLATLLTNNNITESYFFSKLKENLQVEKVQQNIIGNNVKITDEMAYKFLEKYHYENTQYLIKDLFFDKNAPKHTAAEYNVIIEEAVTSYYDNSKMPKDISINDLGYKSLAQLPSIYQDITLELKKGKPSHIIIAPNGLHSLLLVDKKEPESIQFEQAKVSLYREGLAKELTLWLDKLKQAAYIKLYIS